MKNWKTHSRKTALDCGKFLKVEYHHVEFDDGTTIPEWPWVIAPNYINVVVQREEGDFLIYHQSKYAIDGDSLAIVGGYVEPGEEPLEAAKRELLEETGYEASSWTALGSYAVDSNRGCGNGHFFLATGARPIQDIDSDDLESYEILTVSKDELIDALKLGRFKVMPWAAAIALALPHLDIED
jgi:ADP-ribose pyrophosphatase